jgi:GT2 family glycosyltransferase
MNKVSIIVVNHNAGAELADVVHAALAEAPQGELVMVDNASTDGSLATLLKRCGEDGRLQVVRLTGNVGFGRAINAVAPWCRGEWLLLLNPDCLLHPGALTQCLAALQAHPEAAMAGGLLRNPDGSEQRGCRRRLPRPASALAFLWGRLLGRRTVRDFNLTGQPLPPGPVAVEAISGAFMLVRREVFLALGGFDPGYFLHGEDLDLCLRLGQLGHGILFVPQAEATHAQGRCSAGRPFFVAWHKHRSMLRYYALHLARHDPWPLRLAVPLGIVLHGALAMALLARHRLMQRLAPRHQARALP